MKRKLATIMRSEEGQSLIVIAVVMIGLIALMGLAIDGGNLFLQRRNAQNAADAAALAGTRLLAQAIYTCGADPSGADQVVAQEVNRFAERNGMSDTNGVPGDAINDNVFAQYLDKDGNELGQVGGGVIPTGATGIGVHVESEHQTYFMTIVGIDTAPASADAQAMTGLVIDFPAGGGLLPFAIRDTVVEALDEEEEFTALDVDNQHSGGTFCTGEDGTGICVGDTNPNNAHRGWLNLNYIYNLQHLSAADPYNRTFEQNVPNRGCGSDPSKSVDDGLQGWASREGCPYPFPVYAGDQGTTDGDFIHGSPGTRQSSLDAIEDTFEGHTGYAPVFDFVYTSEYMSDHFPTPDRPPDGDPGRWPQAGGGDSAFLYHIVGFVAIQVQDVDTQGNNHSLTGTFIDAVIGEGVFMPGDGFDHTVCRPALVYGVSLWN